MTELRLRRHGSVKHHWTGENTTTVERVSAGAVIFDLDDTLVIEEEVARRSLRQVAGLIPGENPQRFEEVVLRCAHATWRTGPCFSLCQDLGIASWEGLWSTFEGGHPDLDDLRAWARGYRPAVWRQALAEFEVDDPELAAAMADAYVSAQRRGHSLVDGAGDLVRSLAGRRPLGLLTNGPPDIQRLKLDGTGLADCFDAVVISGELGIGKPDPAIFAHTLDQLGAAAASSIMIGDSWERDVLGALGAGMAAVWIADGRPVPEKLDAVSVVDRTCDLGAVLSDG